MPAISSDYTMSFVAKTGVLANEASEGPLPGIALQCARNAYE
jgi:hypothetical protein